MFIPIHNNFFTQTDVRLERPFKSMLAEWAGPFWLFGVIMTANVFSFHTVFSHMLSHWGSHQFWEYRFWCCSHFTEVGLEDQRDCDPPKLSSLPRRAAGGHTECEAKPAWKLGHLNSNLVPLMVSHWRNKISEQTKTNTHTRSTKCS